MEQIDPIERTDDSAAASVPKSSAVVPLQRAAEPRGVITSVFAAAKRFVLALSAAITPVGASTHSAVITPAPVSTQISIPPPAQRTAIPPANASPGAGATTATTATTSQVPAVASAATAADHTAPAATRSGYTATQKASTAACTQSWTYDLQGNVLTHTDRRSITTTNRYDAENRLASQDRAGLTIQSLTRDAQGNVVTQRDALQRDTTFTYDKANRKLSEHRSGLASEAWTYTALGDIATHTDADQRTTTNTYTVRRFLDTESLAGETTRYTVDGVGHHLTRERPKGQDTTWTYGYDAAGNLRTVTDPLNHTTTFDHDANNNRVSVLDANDRETVFAYDERNRLRGKTYAGGAEWQWRYDGDSNRIRSEAPNGRIAETTFDALNRPKLTNYLGAPANEVSSTAWTYDGNGNIRTIVEATSTGPRTETRDYDDFDRLTHAVDSDGRTVSYAYDDVGNRTHLTDHDGRDTVWTYNALNHNTRVFVPGIGTTVHTYTPAGLPDTLTRPDGALTDYAYFATGRLQTLRHAKNGTTLARYDYVYDPNGNRTEQREVNGAVSNDTTQTTIYRYDVADRLTEVEEPNRTSTYTLDDVGNRTAEHVIDAGTTGGAGTTVSSSTLVYNDRDQLTSRTDPIANVSLTQTWDDNGNLATQTVNGAAPRIYTYDARDRLIAMTNPSAGATPLTIAYHSDGLRREKTSTSSTTRYQYDDQSLLAETNAIGNTLRQFHYSATQLIAQTQAGTTPTYRHYLLDALRSPIALLDMAGAVTARTGYDAFGEIRAQQSTTSALTTPNREAANADLASTDNQPIGFTGYLKDQESGLYYAKARYYDPATARFTTEDPEAGKDLEPPSLHRYLYAYANPTVYVDPTGRQSIGDDDIEKAAMALGWNNDQYREALNVQAGAREKTAGFLWHTGKEIAAGLRDGAKHLARMYLSDVVHFPESDTAVDDAVRLANNLSNAPTVIAEHYADKSLRHDKLMSEGKYFEAGGVYGPEGAFAATAFTGTTLALTNKFSSGRATVIEGASGKPAAQLERRMELNPDNDLRDSSHVGSSGSLSRATVINPSGRRDNCSACVAATIQNKLERRTPDDLVTADQIERQHGYSGESRAFNVDQSLAYIEQATGTVGTKTPIAKAGAPVGPYAVFGKTKENGGGHVMYGQVLPNGKFFFYDPQAGGGRISLESIQSKYKDLKSYYMTEPE